MLKHALRGHTDGVHYVAISGDSKLIASGSYLERIIKLWCADTGKEVCAFQGNEDGVCCVDFKGQSTLVSRGMDSLIKVWAIRDGEAPALMHTLRGHTGTVLTVKVSPDGMKMASGSDDETVRIWSVQSSQKLLKCRGHQANIMCVAWSSDSRLVASAGGHDMTVRVWDAEKGTQVMEPLKGHDHAVSSVVLNTATSLFSVQAMT
jgi:WD40 repeat protein